MKHMKFAKWPAVATMTALLGIATLSAQSAPLSNGTLLTIKPGVVSADLLQCLSGSCLGWNPWGGLVAPFVFIPLNPGKDGGIVIGKNQRSGGQEIDLSLWANPSSAGDMVAAFEMGGGMATLTTAPMAGARFPSSWQFSASLTNASYNRFNDTSCAGAGCIGITELGSLNYASYGEVAFFGTAANPCVHPSVAINPCSADQVAGVSVNEWTVNTDKTYVLDYSWVSAEPSTLLYAGGFNGQPIRLHLEGIITTNPPVLESVWKIPGYEALWLFGKGLVPPPNGTYTVNGVSAPIVQKVDTTMYMFIPTGVTAPYTVTVNTPDGASVYPKPN